MGEVSSKGGYLPSTMRTQDVVASPAEFAALQK